MQPETEIGQEKTSARVIRRGLGDLLATTVAAFLVLSLLDVAGYTDPAGYTVVEPAVVMDPGAA